MHAICLGNKLLVHLFFFPILSLYFFLSFCSIFDLTFALMVNIFTKLFLWENFFANNNTEWQ